MGRNARMDSLQDAAQSIKAAATPQEKAASLDRAFLLFKEETEKLAEAYHGLQKKFEAVNLELQGTNEKLNEKVEELHFATNYLDSILSQMSQGLLFVDATGSITTCNRAAEKILGRTADTLLLQSFWTYFSDELFGFSMRAALSEKKNPGTAYTSITDSEGNVREVEVETSCIMQENTQGIIVLLRDITELRRLQILAARNDRLKELGEMAAMVAHEIRNPLGGIKGFASLLERDLKDNPDLAKMAGYIIEGTDTLNRLVGTVLNYSRPLQLKFESTDLGELITDLLEHVKADPSVKTNIQFSLKTDKQPVFTPADPAILKGALLNLVVNAIQAMPDGGSLTISISKEEGRALIKVTDTGIGIAPQNMQKLFSPFFTTRADGNGFGLAEVYKVVQGHGGTIEADSVQGKGTTFTLKLPLQTGNHHGH